MPGIFETARNFARDAAQSTFSGEGGLSRLIQDRFDAGDYGGGSSGGGGAGGAWEEPQKKAAERGLSAMNPDDPPRRIDSVPVFPGIEGGQCPGVLYSVSGTWTLYNADGSVDIENSTFSRSTYGPVHIGPSIAFPGATPNPAALMIYGHDFRGTPQTYSAGGSGNTSKRLVVTSLNIERVDGQPDDCGNRPPSLPDTSPPPNSPSPGPYTDDDGNTHTPCVGPVYFGPDEQPYIPINIKVETPNGETIDFDFSLPMFDSNGDPLPLGWPFGKRDDGRPFGGGASGGAGAGANFYGDDGDDEEEDCDICGKLDQILALFAIAGSGSIDLSVCGAGEDGVIADWQGAGFVGIYQALDAISLSLTRVNQDTRCLPQILGQDEFPVQVPLSFWGEENETISINNIPELISWSAKQLDAIGGQFPAKIVIKNAEGEENEISLNNIAEALVEVYGLATQIAVDSEYCTRASVSTLTELAAVKNIGVLNQDYLEANTEYMGYRGNPEMRTIQYAFNPRAEDPSKFLEPSSHQIPGWQFEDKGTIKEDLIALRFSGGIIKSVFARGLSQLAELGINEIIDAIKNIDGQWEEFIKDLKDPVSQFNRDQPTPNIIDRDKAQKEQ